MRSRRDILESRISRLEKMMNEESYANDVEGQIVKLFDGILDLKDEMVSVGDANPGIKRGLSKAGVALDKALDAVSGVLNYVQSL